jgi:hypothetical protein
MAREEKLALPEDLDALLREAMSVDPSPAFLPRVRARIQSDHPAPVNKWRILALAGAAAALFLVAGSLRDIGNVSDRADPPLPPPRVAYAVRPEPRAHPSADDENAVVRGPVRPSARRAHATVGSSKPDDMPPVVVDRRQRTALDQMMRMIAQGQLTEEAFAHTLRLSTEPIEDRVIGISVQPLEVSPMNAGGVLQSGVESKQPPRPADAGFSRP